MQKDPRYLLESDLQHFATEIDIDIRTVKSNLSKLAKDTESESRSLAEEYKDTFESPAIVDDILGIIAQRTAKAKA